MTLVIDVVSGILLVSGAAFCVIGGIGLLRLPDFYTRTHAATITDTMGVTLVLGGLALREVSSLVAGDGSVNVIVKLIVLIVFIYLTSPTAGHALAKAAYAGGVRADQLPGVEPPARASGRVSTGGGRGASEIDAGERDA